MAVKKNENIENVEVESKVEGNASETNTVSTDNNIDLKKQLDEKTIQVNSMQSQIDEMKTLMQTFMSNQNNNSNVQIIDKTSTMDRPCTLIHLVECPKGLPTTIKVNNIEHAFSEFGQPRTFRFADMQNIVQKYREWFDRGIFTLGDDCTEYMDDLGIRVVPNQIPVETYKKIEQLSLREFELLVKNLNEYQRVYLSKTWVQRYNEFKGEYANTEKIKILNKYTKDKTVFKGGLLQGLIREIANSDEDIYE